MPPKPKKIKEIINKGRQARIARRAHHHHIPHMCATICICEDCFCRNIPLDQQDDYDKD